MVQFPADLDVFVVAAWRFSRLPECHARSFAQLERPATGAADDDERVHGVCVGTLGQPRSSYSIERFVSPSIHSFKDHNHQATPVATPQDASLRSKTGAPPQRSGHVG